MSDTGAPQPAELRSAGRGRLILAALAIVALFVGLVWAGVKLAGPQPQKSADDHSARLALRFLRDALPDLPPGVKTPDRTVPCAVILRPPRMPVVQQPLWHDHDSTAYPNCPATPWLTGGLMQPSDLGPAWTVDAVFDHQEMPDVRDVASLGVVEGASVWLYEGDAHDYGTMVTEDLYALGRGTDAAAIARHPARIVDCGCGRGVKHTKRTTVDGVAVAMWKSDRQDGEVVFRIGRHVWSLGVATTAVPLTADKLEVIAEAAINRAENL